MKKIAVLVISIFIAFSCANKDVEEYMSEAKEFSSRGEVESSIKSYSKAIQKQKDLYDAYLQRGLLYTSTKKYDEAQKDFDFVIANAKDQLKQIEAKSYKSEVVLNKSNFKDAFALADEAIKMNPKEPIAYKYAAKIMLKIKNMDGFCGYLQLALKNGYTEKYGNDLQELYDNNCKF